MGIITNQIKTEFLDTCSRLQTGSLLLETPEGDRFSFGSGAPEADLKLRDWSVVTALAAKGDIGLGETYVAGLWDSPSIDNLVQVALLNRDHFQRYIHGGFWNGLKARTVDRILRANSTRGAARNIRAHYDVGNEFYQLWLDPSMTYSSALFDESGDDGDLLRAQHRKYDRILSRLSQGERVLEIGCGWGGFAERAADQGRDVTGLTISPSQKGFAEARLDGRADIRLQDYRAVQGTFHNIVSIEMIEAVGERYWPIYFGTLKSRLAEGGRALVQAITVPDSYFSTYRAGSDYIRQYTFPGGMLLSDSVIADQARRAGLAVRDSFGFGQDYARTLRSWRQTLDTEADRIRALGFSEPFLRNWRFYLEICAGAFATGQTDVVQVELSHA